MAGFGHFAFSQTGAAQRLQKTDCGCRGFRTGRSKPVIEIRKLNVGYVAMISTIATPAPGQERLSTATAEFDHNRATVISDCLRNLPDPHRSPACANSTLALQYDIYPN